LLSQCYRPEFRYHKHGPTATEAWTLFIREFRFLPDVTSEPERLARLVQHLIHRQQSLKIRLPHCPRHEVVMVLLGRMGHTHVRPKQRLSMSTINQTGNGGGLFVANGLFRCPHRGCFLVAQIEDSATITAS
jgi:hypothetical protein